MKTNKEIITEIITDLEKTVGLNWPTAWNAKVTRDKLIECWSNPSIVDWKYFNYSSHTSLTRVFKKIFSNFKKENRRSWKLHTLYIYGYKYCPKCNNIKNLNTFSNCKSKIDNKYSICLICSKLDYKERSEYYKEYREENKEKAKEYREENKEKTKEYNSKYYQEHKKEDLARQAKHRASKLQRTPVWNNLQEIKEIYLRCPEGYHVDHEIPLQGKLVSGLHVPENLQYLTAKENLSKSNKYKVE